MKESAAAFWTLYRGVSWVSGKPEWREWTSPRGEMTTLGTGLLARAMGREGQRIGGTFVQLSRGVADCIGSKSEMLQTRGVAHKEN